MTPCSAASKCCRMERLAASPCSIGVSEGLRQVSIRTLAALGLNDSGDPHHHHHPIDVSVLRLSVAGDAGASLGLQGGSGSPNGSVARRSATVAVLL